jgi:hypothetical protein
MQNGADLGTQDNSGATVLMYAAVINSNSDHDAAEGWSRRKDKRQSIKDSL